MVNHHAHHFGAIVIMGVSGCGKSTVGRTLAAELHCSFIEGDDFHCEMSIAKMKAGTPLTDDDRWSWLDRIGRSIRASTERDRTAVAACSALKHAYRNRLREAARVPMSFVLLDAGKEELTRRLIDRSEHFMPPSLIDSQIATLERPTSSEQALILNAGRSPGELSATIRQWVSRATHTHTP